MKTIRLKVRPEAYPWLNAAAIEVNCVWNWCAERSLSVYRNTGKWLSGYDLGRDAVGCGKYFSKINQSTVEAVCNAYAQKRKQAKRPKLRWRVSFGARRSLGWMPTKGREVKRHGLSFRTCQKSFRVFNRERLGDSKIRDGSFAQDSVGDWYMCMPVDVLPTSEIAQHKAVGVDLGLKTAAVTSDGDRLESRHYRAYEARIAIAQRRGHKEQAKRLNRKAARCRADALHKFSRMLVNRYQQIYIGDVSSAKLAKTRMAKSVYDAGWYALKQMVVYKGKNAGRSVEIVNERNTTRACSNCGAFTGPAGWTGLVVRQFVCDSCGEELDRDVNAARNIRTVGLRQRASVCGNELGMSVCHL